MSVLISSRSPATIDRLPRVRQSFQHSIPPIAPPTLNQGETRFPEASVDDEIREKGHACIAILQIDVTHRYTATKYTAQVYAQRYLKNTDNEEQESHQEPPHLPKFPTYHADANDDLKIRGTPAERERFLTDVAACAVVIADPSHLDDVRAFGRGKLPWRALHTDTMRRVGAAVAYCYNDVQAARQFAPFYYVRGLYYSGAHSHLGIVIGRVNLAHPEIMSTPSTPIIDEDVRQNFIPTALPTEDFKIGQQGTLSVRMGVPMWDQHLLNAHPNWSVPYNDSFLCGAIHFNRPIYLATTRDWENVYRTDGSPALRIFGRELAAIRGSESYELHTSKDAGELFVPVGAGKTTFDMPDLLSEVGLHTMRGVKRDCLTWLQDVASGLDAGEVVVQTLETLIEGQWVGLRERNPMP